MYIFFSDLLLSKIKSYLILSYIIITHSSFSFKVHILPFTEVGLTMIPYNSFNSLPTPTCICVYIHKHIPIYTYTSFGSPLLIWSWVFNGRMPLLSPSYLVGLSKLVVGNTFIEVPLVQFHLWYCGKENFNVG